MLGGVPRARGRTIIGADAVTCSISGRLLPAPATPPTGVWLFFSVDDDAQRRQDDDVFYLFLQEQK